LKSEKDPNTIKTELQSEAETLVGEGLLLSIAITNLSDTSDSSYLALFLKVHRAKSAEEKCNTAGDQSGEILIPTNLIQLMYDSLTPLGVGTLFSVSQFEVKCGTTAEPAKLKLKIKGESLGLIEPINAEVKAGELGAFSVSLHCSATLGAPAETKYWNKTGEEKTAQLLVNAGVGFERGCEQVEGKEGKVKLETTKMIEIMG